MYSLYLNAVSICLVIRLSIIDILLGVSKQLYMYIHTTYIAISNRLPCIDLPVLAIMECHHTTPYDPSRL